jgi:hypothetical protein
LVGHEASARAGALDGFAGVGLAGGVHVSLVCYLLVLTAYNVSQQLRVSLV